MSACVGETGELFAPVEQMPEPPAAASSTVAASPAGSSGTLTPATEGGPAGALPVATAASPPAAASQAEGAPAAEPAAGEVAPTAGPNPARVCPAIEPPLLLDFAQVASGPTQALFGDFSQSLSGGTFIYPPSSGAAGDPAALGLVSDVTGGDWHITGRVAEPAGFGLFFDCQLLDASRFAGVAFRVSGQVGLDAVVTFRARSASNEVARDWFIATGNGAPATFGRCFPEASQYDGTCSPSTSDVAVTAEGSDVVVRFADLTGGTPEAGVNPAELTAIEWALPVPVAGDAGVVESYVVDLRIDDIRFVEAL
ncbi:MAG TPA: hypothetical protein VNN80_35380 [Polyangiaceae bacterium]|nr:hypothetical protein [Polyangiaceae bacterium]